MNRVLLTIDDYPSQNTPAIVDALCERGIRAILFATGMNVERYYDEALYALRRGMIVGNHSYSHPGFSSLTLEAGIAEIDRCEKLLDRLYQDAGVVRRRRPFRFPYGDKGGKNKEALQQYLKAQGFDKVDDTQLAYPWWREYNMHTDIDTFWTFDFEEYRMQYDPAFTEDSVWEKIRTVNPVKGTSLFREGNNHILLMHAHDETEALMPGYCARIADELLSHGVIFEDPRFL